MALSPSQSFLGSAGRLAVLAVFWLSALTGCGDPESRRAAEDGAADLSGSVTLDGSSTVFPLAEAVAEEFMREHPSVRVTVGVSGTGGGFGKFVRGETDISTASRPMKAEEAEQAAAAGIEFVELPIAYDGLAVVVHPSNTWATCLSVGELKRIWEPGSTIRSWAQVRPGFPDRPLVLYGPGTDSGTYDYFTGSVVGEEGASRTDFSSSEDDNVLATGVAGDEGGLAYFGLAYYEALSDRLSLVGVDPATDGAATPPNCVTPTAETVANGTYRPLARPEFIYVAAASLERPEVRAFAEAFVRLAPELAREVGTVPLAPATMELVRARLAAGTRGTVFSGAPTGVSLDSLLSGPDRPAR